MASPFANAPSRQKTIEKTCPSCGGSFLVNGQHLKQKHCSYKCANEARSSRASCYVVKDCAVCGVIFKSKTRANRRYCGRKCMGESAQRGDYKVGPEARPAMDRIAENINIDPITNCWIWTGCLTVGGAKLGSGGYAKIKVGEKHTLGHIVSYEAHHGPVPEGLELDHKCRNRACVNPDHVEAVDHRINMIRSPITFAGINAAKTHCVNGHSFTEENTYLRPRRAKSQSGWGWASEQDFTMQDLYPASCSDCM